MNLDVGLNDGADGLRHRRAFGRREARPEDARDLLQVPVDEGRDERVLAGKVLVERADVDAGDLGDAVGAGAVVAFAKQNASSGVEQRGDGGARALLGRLFPRTGLGSGAHRGM
jgi:hypothetical protein